MFDAFSPVEELDGLDPPDLPAIIPARSKPVLHAMKSLGPQQQNTSEVCDLKPRVGWVIYKFYQFYGDNYNKPLSGSLFIN